ncbi:MAG: hypothetical protein IAE83_12160 [Anaerolinea sp.]|nr:hypothetical protein [Anaerolinea sp.]MCC6974704.1 hypothetical protein [Anaerolineae bacterium]
MNPKDDTAGFITGWVLIHVVGWSMGWLLRPQHPYAMPVILAVGQWFMLRTVFPPFALGLVWNLAAWLWGYMIGPILGLVFSPTHPALSIETYLLVTVMIGVLVGGTQSLIFSSRVKKAWQWMVLHTVLFPPLWLLSARLEDLLGNAVWIRLISSSIPALFFSLAEGALFLQLLKTPQLPKPPTVYSASTLRRTSRIWFALSFLSAIPVFVMIIGSNSNHSMLILPASCALLGYLKLRKSNSAASTGDIPPNKHLAAS